MSRIHTLLVANRGEIARRVIRTARAMGIRTVAVYSDPDASAPHVAEADQAVPLGGAAPAESYLDRAKLLDAVRRSAADAVHPGYGFLSENADFAQACARAGVVFVGPSPESIREMGLKHRAKQRARKAGLPVLPDTQISGEDTETWIAAAAVIGYPLLVKPTAGGGGTGLRRVTAADELVEAVRGTRRQASSLFGDPRVFCERYLPAPRHVEVQILGDAYGTVLHLFERECSVQRRHQKVLEEAPSPAVDETLRARMTEATVAFVHQLGYVGVGTVEYLLDDSSGEPRFFFLEMNTRLQVEHPVTEEITGLDLVRLQLEVAMGLRLPLRQEDVVHRGHAIEVRLCAEEPARGFLPSPGPLYRYTHRELPGIRYEDVVAAPSEVCTHYDPMLAKVIAHAATRDEAAARLAAALRGMQLHGTVTNRDFLVALLRDPAFLAGQAHTDFIECRPDLRAARCPTPHVVHLAAAVAVTAAQRRAADPATGHAPPGWRLLPGSPRTTAGWERVDGDRDTLEVGYRLCATGADTVLELSLDGAEHRLLLRELALDGVRVCYEGTEWFCSVVVAPDGVVWVNDADGQTGWWPRPRLAVVRKARPEGGQAVAVPDAGIGMPAGVPGVVVAVRVEPGDWVAAGQPLVVLEAMKMEHPALATIDGVVAQVHVDVGQYVQANAVLVTLSVPERT